MQNFQRDGHMQMAPQAGRVSYEPSALGGALGEDTKRGYRSFAAHDEGDKLRTRPASFADHYSQARQFFYSQTKPEQDHIVAALVFELSKVETKAVRSNVLGQLANIDARLSQRVADGMAHRDPVQPAPTTKRARTDLRPSPALSILAKAKPTLQGRVIGCLVGDGADAGLLNALRSATLSAGGQLKVIAPKIGGVVGSDGGVITGDYQLAGGPSVLFDAVTVLAGAAGVEALRKEAAAAAFVHDAFAHLKVIGYVQDVGPLLEQGGAKLDDPGVVLLGPGSVGAFIDNAKRGRIWPREPTVRQVA